MPVTLDTAQVGDTLTIQAIDDINLATLAMRLGISVGETLKVVSKVPAGPLVVSRGKMEIALGRELCAGIQVAKQP